VSDRRHVLVLSRSYPNALFPTLGLWVERPTRLLAETHDVTVVSPVPWCPPLPEVGPVAHYARFRRIPRAEQRGRVRVGHPRLVTGPGTTLYPLEARAYHRAVRRLVDRLRGSRPFDLVHAHFIYPDGVVASEIAGRLGIPFVVTEHAPWTGWLDRLGIARQALPAARAASFVMPVSTSVERSIRAYARDTVRTEVVPVGVDADEFPPSAGAERRANQVLFVGFINYVKGVDVLLDAVTSLVRRGVDVRLLLAGGAHYRNTHRQEVELRKRAASLGLNGRATFLGRVPPGDVARLMSESAVVVLPSRAESFGAVLVEALACGTPVVATRCGGPEDIVDESVGVLVAPGSADELAGGIAHVLEHASEYEPALLRDYALSRFGARAVAERIANLYARALGVAA
jgi:glycosyltransferase involved in cell wall biosynthesis